MYLLKSRVKAHSRHLRPGRMIMVKGLAKEYADKPSNFKQLDDAEMFSLDINRDEMGLMIASGDTAVLQHIRKAIKLHGMDVVQDAVGNQISRELAKVSKSKRGSVKQNVLSLEPEINKILSKSRIDHFPVLYKAARSLHTRIEFQGLQLSIENRRGSIRQWYDPNANKEGMSRMSLPYGYIRMTEGVDGDHVDCFVGPHHDSTHAFIVRQKKAPEFIRYDEDKVMLGFRSAVDAKAAYMKHYDDRRFFGSMIKMPMEEFKAKVLKTKNRPAMLKGK